MLTWLQTEHGLKNLENRLLWWSVPVGRMTDEITGGRRKAQKEILQNSYPGILMILLNQVACDMHSTKHVWDR